MIKGKRKLPQLSFCNRECVGLISSAVQGPEPQEEYTLPHLHCLFSAEMSLYDCLMPGQMDICGCIEYLIEMSVFIQ